MNKIILIGNLTKNPEMRATQSGKMVCNFDIAVNDRRGDATFFHISAWEKLGDSCYRHLSKGKKVCVTGPVSARAYTTQSGEARVSVEVAANDVEFLSPRDEEVAYQQQERNAIENEMTPVAMNDSELPF